jgi:hypothetical protein
MFDHKLRSSCLAVSQFYTADTTNLLLWLVKCAQGFGVVAGVPAASNLPLASLPKARLIGQTAQVKDTSGKLKMDALRVVGAAVKCQPGDWLCL